MEDIIELIKRKIWTVEDQLLPQLREIEKRARDLSPEERKRIPKFSGDWSEEEATRYLKELEKAVKEPIKYKNKLRLEEIGLKTERIADDILGDTYGIDEVLESFQQLKKIEGNIAEILITEDVLASWLREGTDNAKEKLKGIMTAMPAFKRIIESGADEELISELVRRSIKDITFLKQAEDIIGKFKNLYGYRVKLEYDGDFAKLYQNLQEISTKLKQVQLMYGISEAEIKNAINGTTLLEAVGIVTRMEEECAERKRKLLGEWDIYASTLKSIGQGVLEPPTILRELEKAVEDLRNKCLGYLGESGLELLKFLKGEAVFPQNVGIEEIKKALELLRPLFLKALKEGR